jgi:hypothetical protein
MSYNVTISRNIISPYDDQAWVDLDKLYEKENSATEQGQDFLDLIEKLKEKFPCISDLPDDKIDEGVWSDGPLSGNAGKDLTTLGVVYSQVDNAIPFLIKTANECGFVVFDPQTGIISRPPAPTSNSDKKMDNVKASLEKPKSFWGKLFGK